jgi:isoleucyl-tRNA synthetase
VKELEYLSEDSNVLVKKIKPDFKALGPKYGKEMKAVAAAINQFDQEAIAELEKKGEREIEINGRKENLLLNEVEISSEDIPGWLVSSDGDVTVALDITISPELEQEGLAREFVNRIQNLRKDSGFEVTDRITLKVDSSADITEALERNLDYICAETLTESMSFESVQENGTELELINGKEAKVILNKI